jgi:hypothetical protein
MRYTDMGLSAAEGDAGCSEAPWVLSLEETQRLYEEGQDTVPDLIHARGVPATPDPALNNVEEIRCTLILVEVGFCRDLRCDTLLTDKTEKYSPLVAALEKYSGRVEFITILIGHAGTTLLRPLEHLIAALSTVHPHVEQARANMGVNDHETNSNARSHDYRLFKSLLASLRGLTQSRLFDIIRNIKRLV